MAQLAARLGRAVRSDARRPPTCQPTSKTHTSCVRRLAESGTHWTPSPVACRRHWPTFRLSAASAIRTSLGLAPCRGEGFKRVRSRPGRPATRRPPATTGTAPWGAAVEDVHALVVAYLDAPQLIPAAVYLHQLTVGDAPSGVVRSDVDRPYGQASKPHIATSAGQSAGLRHVRIAVVGVRAG
jgi:hypothetical protein